MKNYFTDVRVEHKGIGHYPIRWNRWSPDSIIFKSNRLVKKVMPEDNILSYKSKNDRNVKTCEKLDCTILSQNSYNGTPYTYRSHDKYSAVHVQLKNTNDEFVGANVDFIDMRAKMNVDSCGNQLGCVDILTYINSMHNPRSHHYCTKTQQWVKDPNAKPAPLEEGYRMAYGGQGEGNMLSMNDWDEYLDICKAIRMFLYEVIVPAKKGEFDYDQLEELMVA
jgi:hypothetical protein